MEKEKKIIKNISAIVMISTLLISYFAYKKAVSLEVLPEKYINYIIYGLTLSNLIFIILALVKKIGNIGKIIQIVLCITFSLLLIYGCILIPRFKGNLGRMFTEIPNVSVLNMRVYTLTDSPYEKLKDLINGKLGIQSAFDVEHQNIALEDIENQVKKKGKIYVEEYKDIYSVALALLNKEVDAILLTDEYAEIISKNADFEHFFDKTKTIYIINQEVVNENKQKMIPNITNTPFVVAIGGNDSFDYSSIKNNTGRTDVNLVVAVNPLVKKIIIVTITRDAYLPINGELDKMDRLTNASSLGVDAWKKAIEYGLGIKIDKYMRINFTAFINVIQYLGGLDIDNPYYFSAKRSAGGKGAGSGMVDFNKGNIHVNGYEALSYSRERKSLPLGDFDRNMHNAILMECLIEKIITINNLNNINSFLNAVEGTFVTDVSLDEINNLVKMQLEDNAKWEYDIVRVYGGETLEHSYTSGAGQGYEQMYVAHLDESMVKTAKEKITALLNEDIEE